jgi:soluble P-type ATPase
MDKKGLEIEIPGWGELRLKQALLDLNGTLARDGILPQAVGHKLTGLQELLEVYLITADTHGKVSDLVGRCGGLKIVKIQTGSEAKQKNEYLKKLGRSQTVVLGNGANDALMLGEAGLGICVMQGEGTALKALLASDVLVRSAEEGLDLLLHPARLVATLRS